MATINHPGVVDVYDYGSDQQVALTWSWSTSRATRCRARWAGSAG